MSLSKDVIVKFTRSCAPYCQGELAKVSPDWAQAYVAKGVAEIHGPPAPREKSGDWSRKQSGVSAAKGDNATASLRAENAELRTQMAELKRFVETALGKQQATTAAKPAAPQAKAAAAS